MTAQRGVVFLAVLALLTLLGALALAARLVAIAPLQADGDDARARRAALVAEAGLAHARWRLARAHCGPLADLPATPFGADSYRATLTPDRAPAISEYTLTASADTWLDEQAPTATHGGDDQLALRVGSGQRRQALLRFDTSVLPAGARIAAATLHLHVLAGDPEQPLRLHRAARAWTEADADWATLGEARVGPQGLAAVPPVAGPADVALNVTPWVQAWVNGALPADGFLLRVPADGAPWTLASREWADPAQRPRLVVQVADGPVSRTADLVATGRLADGGEAVRSARAVPRFQAPLSVLRQPGPAALDDTWLDSLDMEANYGAAPWLVVSNTAMQHALLRFDLAAIPPGARVVAARLALYLHDATRLQAARFEVMRVVDTPVTSGSWWSRTTRVRPWAEGAEDGARPAAPGATWATLDGSNDWQSAGGDFDPAPLAAAELADATPRWVQWDITELVQGWRVGRWANHGLLLRAATGTVEGARFVSSDSADTDHHPRLLLTLACPCGTACALPDGEGRVLLVVGDPASPTAQDDQRAAALARWGYTVQRIDDGAEQAEFDAALAASDVVWIAGSADGATLGTRLRDTLLGVVNEAPGQAAPLGLADAGGTVVADALDLNASDHPVSGLWPAGPRAVADAAVTLATWPDGAAALRGLLESGGTAALATLEAGAARRDGSPAPARRALLFPGPDGSGLDWRRLSGDGELLLGRTLAWARCAPAMADRFDTVSFANNDGALPFAGDWQEVDGAGAGPADGNVRISGGELRLDDRPDTAGQPSLARGADLSGVTRARLQLRYALGEGVDSGSDRAVLEVSRDGLQWATLQDFSTLSGGSSGTLDLDLAGWTGAPVQLRLRIVAGYGGKNEYLALDSLRLLLPCTAMP